MPGSMKRMNLKSRVSYLLVVFLCLFLSLAAGSTTYATRIDHYFYDQYFHQRGPQRPSAQIVIVAIDDATLARYGALPLNRSLLARAIRAIQQAHPLVIAIDILLTDASTAQADGELEQALGGEPRPCSRRRWKRHPGTTGLHRFRSLCPRRARWGTSTPIRTRTA